MFLNLIKEINRLLSKGMWNIYSKITAETSSKLQFLGLKNFSPAQIREAPTHSNSLNYKSSC